jgi:hypothetical protein
MTALSEAPPEVKAPKKVEQGARDPDQQTAEAKEKVTHAAPNDVSFLKSCFTLMHFRSPAPCTTS